MFRWLQKMTRRGSAGKLVETSTTAAHQGGGRQSLVDSLDDLIKTPGKACYRTLGKLASDSSKDEFILFVHCPAFVGSGIRNGSLERGGAAGGKWQRTQMFSPSEVQALVEGASLEQSIFLLRKPIEGNTSELRRFSIGRTQENDLLMMDFAISRAHASVELRGDGYFLKDLGSSNGTYVNGQLIDDRGTLLEDGDTIRFARYEFQYLSAGALYDLLRQRNADRE
jgi:hypothetical protein